MKFKHFTEYREELDRVLTLCARKQTRPEIEFAKPVGEWFGFKRPPAKFFNFEELLEYELDRELDVEKPTDEGRARQRELRWLLRWVREIHHTLEGNAVPGQDQYVDFFDPNDPDNPNASILRQNIDLGNLSKKDRESLRAKEMLNEGLSLIEIHQGLYPDSTAGDENKKSHIRSLLRNAKML